jgi:DNA excision repair protein ERCC-3
MASNINEDQNEGGCSKMQWLSGEPPLLIQKDLSVWLPAEHPEAEEAMEMLSRFAELAKSPGHLHLFRITPLALWNAASAGMEPESICRFLHAGSKLGLPQVVRTEIKTVMGRYGQLCLDSSSEGGLLLKAASSEVMDRVRSIPAVARFFRNRQDDTTVEIDTVNRGRLKQELIRSGYPVEDKAGFLPGEPLMLRLRERLRNGARFTLRGYQQQAVEAFKRGGFTGGSGVLVLPCGAGKTAAGLAVMEHYGCETLILTPSGTSVTQWRREILDKTDLAEELVGEYSADAKKVRPVTIATYQILTHRSHSGGEMVHLELFSKRNWGLIIYDEVHLLPAPVFRMTADLQSKRRLGLTATLIREDGHEADVFTLVGPKRYEVQWKQLEKEGWLAKVSCTEVRIPFEEGERSRYICATAREKIRVAGENNRKLHVLRSLLEKHSEDRVLIIGHYLDQLHKVAEETDTPLISGEMKHEERERLFQAFRDGHLPRLVVSKVANFAVDLPDASVAVQLSGSFGSRQEEAQRMGRILRPKAGANEARFYTLVTEDSKEQDFALNRQLFLLEQGYRYEVTKAASEAWQGQEEGVEL